MRGKVERFLDQKGYGFIRPEDGSKDVFVHYTGIVCEGRKTLVEGTKVEFSMGKDERGRPKAIDVHIVKDDIEVK